MTLGGFFTSTSRAEADQATVCDALDDFAITKRFVANELHREAVRLSFDFTRDDREQRAQELLPRLHETVKELLHAPDAKVNRVAILTADLAELAKIADPKQYGKAADDALRKVFELLLSNASDVVEVDYLVNLASSQAHNAAEQIDAVKRHYSVAGAQIRQVAALDRMGSGYEDAGDRLRFARAMREIAPSTGNARAVYDADAAFVIAAAEAAVDSDAKAIASGFLPVARSRLERWRADFENGEIDSVDGRCLAQQGVVAAINELLKDTLPQAEMEANYRLEALETVTFGELATDYAGASQPYAELLGLRAIDDASYRDLMRYFARINPGANDAESGEIGMAISGADIFDSMMVPDLARELFRDAKSWSAGIDDPAVRFLTLQRSLRFEWRAGSASRLDADIAEARAILAAHGDRIDPVQRIQFAVFEAEFYDSRLEDREAAAALGQAIDLASTPYENVSDAGNVTTLYDEDISRLVVDHLRNRFCGGCGGLMRPMVERWWRAAVDADRQTGNKTSEPMTFEILKSDAAAAQPLKADAQQEILRILALQRTEVEAYPKAAEILDSLDPNERERVLVASRRFADQEISSSSVLTMLTDQDVIGVRRVLDPIVSSMAAHYSNFGIDTAIFETLSAFAEALTELRFPIAAQAVDDNIARLDEPGHNIKAWTEPDANARLQIARVLAPAYARLGGYAVADQDWRKASARLDQASQLMSARLKQEWQVGNDQAGLLYQAFQPSLKHVAELRFLVAGDMTARQQLPDAVERTFADLQSAMLGDTALATQTAIKNSITRDVRLRDAVDARDRALGTLAQIEATEAILPSKLPWVIRKRREEAHTAITAASAVIAEKLTVSEDLASLSPSTVADAESALEADEALAMLHVGSAHIYGLVLRPGLEPFLFVSPIAATDLSDRIAKLRRQASSFGAVDMGNAAALYDVLLRPAEAALERVGHLIVVGDGPLPGLPWAMLSTGATIDKAGGKPEAVGVRGAKPIGDGSLATVDWAAQPFLIRRFPVSLSPSVRSLVAQRKGLKASEAPKPFFGIGNPLLGGAVPAQEMEVASLFTRDGGVDVAALSDLAPLPETADELRALAASFKVGDEALLLAGQATESRLAERSLSDYRVLAFATHGILAGEVGGTVEPGLVLSPEAFDMAGRDGYLSLSEIMALKLDADLVILSACNTGGADGRPRAEWMSGLARGFIAAGARQLLVTLWAIPSKPTVRLTTGMTGAHAEAPGSGWPRALQASILAMIDKPVGPAESHPASWASFTVLGVGSR
ncbi:CHAT domain-containing protein [Oryzicola mucosus]|uniref:CHAT domain-containing protein n=1 Tax=Oryzicola mucosus TaxID=2767425 RepID=A0A8J6U6L6_9HYPH|nr:CHAT domain-containing protein [Oryzicola mucosus]MBD0413322.1 CHAT domain-containing protein [Oryzicola mucosus]